MFRLLGVPIFYGSLINSNRNFNSKYVLTCYEKLSSLSNSEKICWNFSAVNKIK